MKSLVYAIPLAVFMLLASLLPIKTAAAGDTFQLNDDALHPPKPRLATAALAASSPSLYQPSAFMAGRVAVQVLLPESDGSREASRQNWTNEQIAAVRQQIAAALDWWRGRLPQAGLSFDLSVKIAPTGYEPIDHTLSSEGDWIGDAFSRMGLSASNYFDQAYQADDLLRRARGVDWATTIFVANSAGVPGGRFADGRFAYAYIGGPFMVVTSDGGPYGTSQLAQVVAHEFGHIFGALDQYASAGTPCSQLSGYLGVATTNSQAGNCGTHYPSIMLEPLSAYANGQVDDSALGQVGYRDSDGDGLLDPIDTAPTLTASLSQPASGRPFASLTASDQPFISPLQDPVTINTIARVEYRVDGGAWNVLAAEDGAYNEPIESVDTLLPLYDGQHIVDMRAVNSRGAGSPIVHNSVRVAGVGSAPFYQVDVPALSDREDITVGLSAPAGSSVQVASNPFFAGASWAPAAAQVGYHLSPLEGSQSLYVRFRDANGLESPPYLRTVLLDRTPPSGDVIRHAGTSPWLEIQAHDSGSGIAEMQIVEGDGSSGVWQPFQSRLPMMVASASLQVRVRDQAGNASAPLAILNGGPVYLSLVTR